MHNILHICNDFLGSKIYRELYACLSDLGFDQTVFVPMRKSTVPRLNTLNLDGLAYQLVPSKVMKKYHRYFFGLKRKYLYKSLEMRVDLQAINIVHATTLFSDGAIAYEIFRKYRVPYIVTIRNTDISGFMKYRPDLLPLAKEIIINAKHVCFISHSLKNKFVRKIGLKFAKEYLESKSLVLPNGLNSFWLTNRQLRKKSDRSIKVIYVGTLIHRKNVPALVKAVLNLKHHIPNLSLTIVGEGGRDEKIVKSLANLYPDTIKYHGFVQSMNELECLFAQHDIFAMPSYNETFGLVYIEALSRGLPILYSKEEGVDGFIPVEAGHGVNPYDLDDIVSGLKKMIIGFDSFDLSNFEFDIFQWPNIAKSYEKLYQPIFLEK